MKKNRNYIKKNRTYLFFAFFVIFIFLSTGLAYALEVKYPDLTAINLPDINQPGAGLAQYAIYFFGLGVYLVGVISVISFAVGAVTYIMSGESAGTEGEAKDRMKGAVIGLVLTIASALIISLINPRISTPTLTPLPPSTSFGVYYSNGTKTLNTPQSDPDLTQLPSGFGHLKYTCNSDDGPKIIVWVWQTKNFEDTSEKSSSAILSCNSSGLNLSGALSLKWDYETPGIYFCSEGCKGDGTCAAGPMSTVITNDQDFIDSDFAGHIKGIMFYKANKDDAKYGVILHGSGLGSGLYSAGVCSSPIFNSADDAGNSCQAQDMVGLDLSAIDAKAANVFLFNTDTSSGNGVSFYSQPNGWNNNNVQGKSMSGVFEVKNDIILPNHALILSPSQMCFNYSNSAVPPNGRCKTGKDHNSSCDSANDCSGVSGSDDACESFANCMGSINIKSNGGYLVGIYSSGENGSGSSSGGAPYCQTFPYTISDLGLMSFMQPGDSANFGSKINQVIIIATQ